MKSAPRGRPTSDVEVTNVSAHGFWLLIGKRELFVPFDRFPWFKDVPIGRILNVELTGPDHLYWSDIDVDLSIESIEHPERFPLMSRARIKGLAPAGRAKLRRAKRVVSGGARGRRPAR